MGKEDIGGGNNIRVAVRIRPFNSREVTELQRQGISSSCCFDIYSTSVVTRQLGGDHAFNEYTRAGRSFGFDEVFSSIEKDKTHQFATQETVFKGIGLPILENALDAYNGCLLAYGQTGSGKSHSVLGDPSNEQEKGLLPRACERLFDMVNQRRRDVEQQGSAMEVSILASYLEIYQEKLYDLLVSTRSDLQVRLHKDLGPHVPGLTQTPVKNISEVHELLDFGAKNRVVGATSMNAVSSRSHAVFTIDLRITISIPGGTKDMHSKITFVDLAGSEKQKKTGAAGERLQEGIAINQSLSALSRVIQALAGTAGKNVQPPFRESKLTLLLKDALSGNSRTVLLACISPSQFNVEESISTLEFASRCKLIKTNAKKNEQDKAEMIESLQAEKKAIADQLELEAKQRLLLQRELEKEMQNARRNQELAEKMSQEKLDIERQLRELETESSTWKHNDQENMLQKEEALKKAAEELKHRMAEHEALQLENDKVKQEREQEAARLEKLLREQEQLEQDHRQKSQEMERIRLEKEKQVAQAEGERLAALKALEESKRSQEEEHRKWAEQQEQERRRARELEEQLAKQQQADSASKRKLEEEHQQLLAHLEKERQEQEKRMQQAEALRQEREQQLSKVDEDRKRVELQLQELRDRQKAEQERHEALAAEKERQAQELKRLEEAAAREREARQAVEEKQKAFQAAKQAEIERLEKEKDEQLRVQNEQHEKIRNELQEKLDLIQRQEEARRAAEQSSSQKQEAELRQKLEDEVRKRKHKEETLQAELNDLTSLSENWKAQKEEWEKQGEEQRMRREQLLKDLGIQGLGDDAGEDSQEVPRLVNMHPDPMLEGCLIYYLKKGDTRIGANPDTCRVCLSGLDVADEVCDIKNEDNAILMVHALPKAFVRVNGVEVTDGEEICLSNGDRLAIGREHIFRVVIPKSHDPSKQQALEIEFSQAMNELREKAKLDDKWRRAVDEAVMLVKREHGTDQANELLKQAKSASDTVACANALLKKVPENWADEVSHYELAVLFEADGLPTVCVVARSADSQPDHLEREASGFVRAGPRTKGIWEAEDFQQFRLEAMVQACGDIQEFRAQDQHALTDTPSFSSSSNGNGNSTGGARLNNARGQRLLQHKSSTVSSCLESTPLRGPTVEEWQSYAWSEVQLAQYRTLLHDHQELKKEMADLEEKLEEYKQEEEKGWFAKFFGGAKESPSASPSQDADNPSGLLGLVGGLFNWAPKGMKSLTGGEEDMNGNGTKSARAARSSSRKARDKKDSICPGNVAGPNSPPVLARNRAKSQPAIHGGPQFAALPMPGSPGLDPGSFLSEVSPSSSSTAPAPGNAAPAPNLRRATAAPSSSTTMGSPLRPSLASKSTTMMWAVQEEDGLHGNIIPMSPGTPAEHADVTVPKLFGGKLGVRLRMEGLVVTGFDEPKAAELGWRQGDEIIAVKGNPVKNKEDFKKELAKARSQLPIVFTVLRRGESNTANTSSTPLASAAPSSPAPPAAAAAAAAAAVVGSTAATNAPIAAANDANLPRSSVLVSAQGSGGGGAADVQGVSPSAAGEKKGRSNSITSVPGSEAPSTVTSTTTGTTGTMMSAQMPAPPPPPPPPGTRASSGHVGIAPPLPPSSTTAPATTNGTTNGGGGLAVGTNGGGGPRRMSNASVPGPSGHRGSMQQPPHSHTGVRSSTTGARRNSGGGVQLAERKSVTGLAVPKVAISGSGSAPVRRSLSASAQGRNSVSSTPSMALGRFDTRPMDKE